MFCVDFFQAIQHSDTAEFDVILEVEEPEEDQENDVIVPQAPDSTQVNNQPITTEFPEVEAAMQRVGHAGIRNGLGRGDVRLRYDSLLLQGEVVFRVGFQIGSQHVTHKESILII